MSHPPGRPTLRNFTKNRNAPSASTNPIARSRTRRRLPKPRATHASSTAPAMTKPAVPIRIMWAKSPAVTQRNAGGSNACSPRASGEASGMWRQPPASASYSSQMPTDDQPEPDHARDEVRADARVAALGGEQCGADRDADPEHEDAG